MIVLDPYGISYNDSGRHLRVERPAPDGLGDRWRMMENFHNWSSGDEAQIDDNHNIFYFDLFQNEISVRIFPDSEIQKWYDKIRTGTPIKHEGERQGLEMPDLKVENVSTWCRLA